MYVECRSTRLIQLSSWEVHRTNDNGKGPCTTVHCTHCTHESRSSYFLCPSLFSTFTVNYEHKIYELSHRSENSSPRPMSTPVLIATSNFIKKMTKKLEMRSTRPSSTATTTLPLYFTNGVGAPPSTLPTAMPLNPSANPSAATSTTSPASLVSLAARIPTKSSTLVAALAVQCATFAVSSVPT